jgi:hypothetical protein
LWVVERAPQQGVAWFAAESIDPDLQVRVLNYGRKPHGYRVFFTVDDDASVVRVMHVRRGARRRPTAGELAER